MARLEHRCQVDPLELPRDRVGGRPKCRPGVGDPQRLKRHPHGVDKPLDVDLRGEEGMQGIQKRSGDVVGVRGGGNITRMSAVRA